MTGRVCRCPRSLIFPTSIVSLWTQLCLLCLKNSQFDLCLSLMLCITVFPMICQHLFQSCIKPHLSNFGSKGGLYLVACLATAIRTSYLLSCTAHFKATTTQHPLNEQSSSTESRLLPEVPSTTAATPPLIDPEKVKKEAVRMAREAEKQWCAQMEKAQQEQSWAVMQNHTSSS